MPPPCGPPCAPPYGWARDTCKAAAATQRIGLVLVHHHRFQSNLWAGLRPLRSVSSAVGPPEGCALHLARGG